MLKIRIKIRNFVPSFINNYGNYIDYQRIAGKTEYP
jgi:hypothetical protein